MLAVGCHDGRILIINPNDMGLLESFDYSAEAEGAVASIKFRPDTGRMNNMLLIAQGDCVSHCHYTGTSAVG